MGDKRPQNGNLGSHPASGTDQISESDLSLPELPEITEDQPSEEKIRVDGEFYKRVGFYSAFNKSSDQEFRQAVARLSKTVGAKIENLSKELSVDLERYNTRKKEADDKITETKASLKLYEQEVEGLKGELPALEKRLEELREEIKTAVIEIGSKKETLIGDRQEALMEELNRLNTELESVVRSRMALNEEIFEKQKSALERKKAFWASLFEKHDKEHAEVLAKLKLFSAPGFHVLSSSFLYNVGLVAATVAGAFFASFAETNYFASGGMLSFIIQGLFNFSTGFIGQSSDSAPSPFSAKLLHAGILLVIFLGLLALMFAVSWICQFAYQQLVQKTGQNGKSQKNKAASDAELSMNAIAIEINMNGELPVSTEVSDKTFFGFWIKILPYLLFLSIAFILVSLGTDITNIKDLDASMAGYATGFLIALASGGISYIYLTMFLERRIEQQLATSQGNATISWFRLNVELLSVILVFITVVLVTLLVFQHPFKLANNTLSVASLMFFAVGCLLTAFILGFGIRLQSLEGSRRELEASCDIIQTKLIRISRPLQIYLTPTENVHFNRKFIQIRDEIMNLILARTMLTRRAIDTPLVKTDEKQRFLDPLNNWLRKRLPWNRSEPTEQKEGNRAQRSETELSSFTASEEIRLCFPKLEAELGALEAEAGEVRGRIDFIEKEIRFRTEQRGEFYEKKLAELRYQEIRSRNYHKAIANRERRSHVEVNREQRREKFFTQKIVEGYELGDWFTQHGPGNTQVPDFVWNSNGDNHD